MAERKHLIIAGISVAGAYLAAKRFRDRRAEGQNHVQVPEEKSTLQLVFEARRQLRNAYDEAVILPPALPDELFQMVGHQLGTPLRNYVWLQASEDPEDGSHTLVVSGARERNANPYTLAVTVADESLHITRWPIHDPQATMLPQADFDFRIGRPLGADFLEIKARLGPTSYAIPQGLQAESEVQEVGLIFLAGVGDILIGQPQFAPTSIHG